METEAMTIEERAQAFVDHIARIYREDHDFEVPESLLDFFRRIYLLGARDSTNAQELVQAYTLKLVKPRKGRIQFELPTWFVYGYLAAVSATFLFAALKP